MSRKKLILIPLVIAVCSIAGGLLFEVEGLTSKDPVISARDISSDYEEAIALIQREYAGEIDFEALTEASVQSMLWSLDPHSSFFTAKDFKKLYEEQSSQFFGIGVSIVRHPDGVYIQSVIPGTPAEKAGLRYGDRFVSVDGKNATDWSSAEVSRNVRGEMGTTVTVEVERPDATTPKSFGIVRGGVPLPSVRNVFMLPNGVGYLGLTGGFQETTAVEFDEAIESLKKQGMTSLVLDLRNNPGGLLNQAKEIVSRFIESGKTVVSVKGRSAYARSEQLLTSGKPMSDLPVAVLINGGSASASEIVAGAVQDYARGIVVGEDSFGKGLVQRVFPLPFGTGLTLTTARYYTPYGRSLQKDYSNGSIYEYYAHSSEDEASENQMKPKGTPVTTANGRVFYGGRGIEPDEKIKSTELNPIRLRINSAAFYFVRKLAYGKVSGFESYRIGKQSFRKDIRTSQILVDDALFAAFIRFVETENGKIGLSVASLKGDAQYARTQLREEIATALYSNEIGQQVLLEEDPQVKFALEKMVVARSLISRK